MMSSLEALEMVIDNISDDYILTRLPGCPIKFAVR